MDDVPLEDAEAVDVITVTRHKKHIVVTSKTVSIALPPMKWKPVDELPPPDPSPCDDNIYSDVEDTGESLGVNRHEQKGESHSVSVCIFSLQLFVQ